MTVSSAYIWKPAPRHDCGKSFIYKLKRSGPRTLWDSCFSLEKRFFSLLIMTHCSQDLNHCRVLSEKLNLESLWIRISWFNVSNYFLWSWKTALTTSPLSNDDLSCSIKKQLTVSVKPNCNGCRYYLILYISLTGELLVSYNFEKDLLRELLASLSITATTSVWFVCYSLKTVARVFWDRWIHTGNF